MKEFDCKKCGTCCRLMRCDKLTDDNLCSIHDTRPDFCNVEKMYQFRKDLVSVSKEEYLSSLSDICAILRKMFKQHDKNDR